MLILCPMFFSPSSLERGEEERGGGIFATLPERMLQNGLEFLPEIWTMLTKQKKYILLELKVPCSMSAISETYNRTHNIFELEDVLPNDSFTASETLRDYY